MKPELIKEVMLRNFDFPKPKTNPLTKLVVTGLANYDGEKWAKHRKIANPAFRQDKLKVITSA